MLMKSGYFLTHVDELVLTTLNGCLLISIVIKEATIPFPQDIITRKRGILTF